MVWNHSRLHLFPLVPAASWREIPISPEQLLLDDLLSRQPLLAALNVIVGVAAASVLSQTVPLKAIGLWLGYLLLVQLARTGLWLVRWRSVEITMGPCAAHEVMIVSAVAGSVWGMAGFLFGGPEESPLFIPFALAGMTGGAITTLPSHPPAFFAFVWATLLPYGLRLAGEADPTVRTMALVTLLYGVGISAMGYLSHLTLQRAAKLSLQNVELVERLESARQNLELAVADRTRELREANLSLANEIVERRRAEEQRELLLRELRHRVKNLLNLVLAIAHQTSARARTTAEFMERFEGQMRALMATHDLLTASGWKGAGLAELASRSLRLHVGDDPERLRLLIEDRPLHADMAQNLGLVLHELATNAMKHGAWSVPGGRVELSGRMIIGPRGPALELVWREIGGPRIQPPRHRGFGTTLLDRAIRGRHRGEVHLDWQETGLVCHIVLPEAASGGPPER
ncbi:sensor histidine kinase [Benzoatithermus flavus]|uniref:histidine kinase n=1 Tax=Benzoatithermus flavus TaxID=3108223 RepID=A0ABU8XYT0_9PROT